MYENNGKVRVIESPKITGGLDKTMLGRF